MESPRNVNVIAFNTNLTRHSRALGVMAILLVVGRMGASDDGGGAGSGRGLGRRVGRPEGDLGRERVARSERLHRDVNVSFRLRQSHVLVRVRITTAPWGTRLHLTLHRKTFGRRRLLIASPAGRFILHVHCVPAHVSTARSPCRISASRSTPRRHPSSFCDMPCHSSQQWDSFSHDVFILREPEQQQTTHESSTNRRRRVLDRPSPPPSRSSASVDRDLPVTTRHRSRSGPSVPTHRWGLPALPVRTRGEGLSWFQAVPNRFKHPRRI